MIHKPRRYSHQLLLCTIFGIALAHKAASSTIRLLNMNSKPGPYPCELTCTGGTRKTRMAHVMGLNGGRRDWGAPLIVVALYLHGKKLCQMDAENGYSMLHWQAFVQVNHLVFAHTQTALLGNMHNNYIWHTRFEAFVIISSKQFEVIKYECRSFQ